MKITQADIDFLKKPFCWRLLQKDNPDMAAKFILIPNRDIEVYGCCCWENLDEWTEIYGHLTYRLRPDYTLPSPPKVETEYEFLEIYTGGFGMYCFKGDNDFITFVSLAPSHCRFVAYADTDKKIIGQMFTPDAKYVVLRKKG